MIQRLIRATNPVNKDVGWVVMEKTKKDVLVNVKKILQ